MNSLTLPELSAWFWQPADRSIRPAAAIGWDDIAEALLEYLLVLDERFYSQLQVTLSDRALIVFGQAEILPWIDGIHYASPCDKFPTLWLPTHSKPSVSIELVSRALGYHYGSAPLLLWPEPAAVIPLDRRFSINRNLLETMPRNWLL